MLLSDVFSSRLKSHMELEALEYYVLCSYAHQRDVLRRLY